MRIFKLKLFGTMQVYERERKHETWIPKYFVFNTVTGKILEEFRRRSSAYKWARENKNG